MNILTINIILLVITIILSFCLICKPVIENYLAYEYLPTLPCMDGMFGGLQCFTDPYSPVIWDGPLRHTHLESYDLRGDPVLIPHHEYEFLNPE